MKYRENKIDGFLSHFIKCFWELDKPGKDVDYTILPDGHFDLILEIRHRELSNIFLTGVWTKPIHVHIDKDVQLIGIRFKLIAAEYIFKQSIKNMLNSTIDLQRNLFAVKNLPFDDFDLFTDYFLESINYGLKNGNELDDRKLKLFELLYENKGNLRVSELAGRVFWSSRQMNRYFNQQFGFSIKTFSNILKCNSSFHEIANGRLFPQQDYFDQAHFIKEIKKYTGSTPKELHKNEHDRFLQLSTLMTS